MAFSLCLPLSHFCRLPLGSVFSVEAEDGESEPTEWLVFGEDEGEAAAVPCTSIEPLPLGPPWVHPVRPVGQLRACLDTLSPSRGQCWV